MRGFFLIITKSYEARGKLILLVYLRLSLKFYLYGIREEAEYKLDKHHGIGFKNLIHDMIERDQYKKAPINRSFF